MSTLRSLMHRRRKGWMETVSDDIGSGAHALAKRPGSVGGLVVLALGLIGLAYMWPEIQRYLRMKRM